MSRHQWRAQVMIKHLNLACISLLYHGALAAPHRSVDKSGHSVTPSPPTVPYFVEYTLDYAYTFAFVAFGTDIPALVPDPAFTFLPVTPGFFTITRFQTTPCGPLDLVSYAPAGIFRGLNASGPSYEVSGGQSWSSNPECCGSGKYIPEPCVGARIEFKRDPSGIEDVGIYDPANSTTPAITISGLRVAPFSLPIPNSTYWAYGVLRWVMTDVAPVTGGIENGVPKVVGHVFNNYNIGPGSVSIAFLPSGGIEGPEADKIKGLVSPFGAALLKDMKVSHSVTAL